LHFSIQVTNRWWFWLIIGLLAAFFIVMSYFAWRGVRHWRAYRACKARVLLGPPGTVKEINDKNSGLELSEIEDGKLDHEKHDHPSWQQRRLTIDWSAVERRTATLPGHGQARHVVMHNQSTKRDKCDDGVRISD
jgi:hypothetical protein